MATRAGSKDAQPGDILLVVHDFVARSPDELSLAKGDRVALIEGDSEFGDGWFLGKHLTNGSSGLFPEVYTTPAPKGTLNNATKPRINDLLTSNPSPIAAATSSTPVLPTAPVPSATTTQPRPTPAVGSSTPSAQPSLRTQMPSSSTGPTRAFTVTSDSPVMSETLSVIDEHMSDMKAPRSHHTQAHKRDTLSSVYSGSANQRLSYIAGHETDEEDQDLTEAHVSAWEPTQVAEYLSEHGVEKAHCDVFKEQDISGEVLLGLDQNSLFIKEFELGSVGRRLKTWHKIKALQDEVRRTSNAKPASKHVLPEDQDSDQSRHRSSSAGAALPRALTTSRRAGVVPGPVSPSQAVPNPNELVGVIPRPSSRPEAFYRPSAQSIRDMNHARRHSSIDSTSTDGAARYTPRKQPLIDTTWQPGQPAASSTRGHAYSGSVDSQFPQRKPSLLVAASPSDVERGYFSSNEVEARPRNKANVLQKRLSAAAPSPTRSRASSVLDMSRTNGPYNRHSIATDPRDSNSTLNSTALASNATGFGSLKIGPGQSGTSPGLLDRASAGPATPMVTKLDQHARTFPPTNKDSTDSTTPNATTSPSSLNQGFFSAARAKVPGLRSISDAVTRNERSSAPPRSSHKDTGLVSPTTPNSSTPSTNHTSMELSKTDSHSRVSIGSGGAATTATTPPALPPTKRPRAKTKTKKDTSAYTRGLLKKPPVEQMQDCDYSGWMKKKSGSLMTTWKPRLFILRGRRLSYYYGEDDIEEKGLIDISFHRVLPAQNEMITGLHATVTGASSTQTSPNIHSSNHSSPFPTSSSLPPTLSEQNLRDHPPAPSDDPTDAGLFIFKLVPPKAGLSKGVNFTKPTVHYFAVNSRQEGRLWMAALMKATIDRDEERGVTTSYNQKTISLAKARERRERPPALREDSANAPLHHSLGSSADPHDERNEGTENGLGIDGLRQTYAPSSATPDEEPENVHAAPPSSSSLLDPARFNFLEDASSLAPSTTTGTSTTEHTLDGSEYSPGTAAAALGKDVMA